MRKYAKYIELHGDGDGERYHMEIVSEVIRSRSFLRAPGAAGAGAAGAAGAAGGWTQPEPCPAFERSKGLTCWGNVGHFFLENHGKPL